MENTSIKVKLVEVSSITTSYDQKVGNLLRYPEISCHVVQKLDIFTL